MKWGILNSPFIITKKNVDIGGKMRIYELCQEELRIFFRYENDEEYYKILYNHLSHLEKNHGKYAGMAGISFKNLTDFNEAVKILKEINKT